MTHKKFIIKIICFAIAAFLAFQAVCTILNPKYLYDNNWPTTQTFVDFYELEEDSIDVIFLGSSHCVSAFSPLELYEKYNISSYNLGSEQQNLLISYYWLKEALQYQNPQAVVLDTYLFYARSDEALNSDESTQRKAIDYMRWSMNKIDAISDICRLDKNQTLVSYYLTNIRFHSRWTELNEDDFTFGLTSSGYGLMGFSALSNRCQIEDYQPFQPEDSAEIAEPLDLMVEYLDKIVQLCEDNSIDLILVKTPNTITNVERYNYFNQYADEHDILYIDFNEALTYEKVGYDFANDNHDIGHINIWGAEKLTDYIGSVLINEYGVSTGKSEEHEELLPYYDNVKKDCNLRTIADFSEYLEQINDTRYVIFISIKDEGVLALDESLIGQLESLGVTVDLTDKYRYSYYTVINADEFNEAVSDQKLSSKGTIRNKTVIYEITSAGYSCGNSSSIIIDGVEYSMNQRGMNIVVYNIEKKKVVDQVCFDTHDGLTVTRK